MRAYVREFLDRFVENFAELGIETSSLVLFGSHAKGTAKLSSDIDIAVVESVPLTSLERGILRGIGEEIDERIEVNLFFTTPQALQDAKDVFDTNMYIRDEGLVLWPL
ncbi:MAG: nucleotidyltransferase domain-containing protein [Defluviitaleaceae bacterium]|nr:nucleotidyltransferase domain-containing protein [Defluviitaleaceae bacterium]